MTTTLVTAFLDLTPYQEKPRRPAEDYLRWGKHLLSFSVPAVVFIEPKWMEEMKDWRPPETWRVYPWTLETSPYISFRTQVQQDLAEERMPEGDRNLERFTSGYHLVVWSKLWCVRKAIQRNPFGSEKFVWMDFGLFHLLSWDQISYAQEILERPFEKIRFMCLYEPESEVTKDPETFFREKRWGMSAQVISGSKEHWLWLEDAFDEELKKLLARHWICLEEHILSYLRAQFPERFQWYYGQYVDVLKNYFFVRKISEMVVSAWTFWRNAGSMHVTYPDLLATLRAREEGKVSFSFQEHLRLLDEAFIASFYVPQEEDDEVTTARKIGTELRDLLRAAPEEVDRTRFQRNLSCVGITLE